MKAKKTTSIITSVLIVLLLAAGVYLQFLSADNDDAQNNATQTESIEEVARCETSDIQNIEIPRFIKPKAEQRIEHLAYTVSYHPTWHIPNWVAYTLESHEVSDEFARTNKFLPDPQVHGTAVVTSDYTGSGYDRGHMAPAADMRWSEQAMRESFYMTNMCPQNHNNNAGDWKDLEELVRDLAVKYGAIHICCGPIVTDTTITIGKNCRIVVPQAFFKVLLRQKTNQTTSSPQDSWAAIGFVMQNKAANKPLMTYMLSVDEVEEMTGIDFFPNLPDSIETAIEADFNVADWTL